MKKILIFTVIMFVALTATKTVKQSLVSDVKKEKSEIMTLGFGNSGSPKDFEDVWVDWKKH